MADRSTVGANPAFGSVGPACGQGIQRSGAGSTSAALQLKTEIEQDLQN